MSNFKRKASVERKTSETTVKVDFVVDGSGISKIDTPLGFWNHMIGLFTFFGGFDIVLKAQGDIEVDDHHLLEDIGICLGKAFRKAIAERKGIRRFGFAAVPMDETLVQVAVDISGRPFLGFFIPIIRNKTGFSDLENLAEFARGFSNHAGINLHLRLFSGENTHHICEAVFKGLGLALKEAVKIESDRISSTKGRID
ncbi:MAG: imidazoleglycerol-phosphate dehydratase HisB [Candidatus Omnitrophica bacterium]|nr:imidazoleglycerol-phosphate dehydratase HisB [Candidatus Omnitrophota bacterium]MCM8817085.1 imidazoleglycerol-phosphate dehydratase HisB [Candidatus Omnitrophota bacterium]